MRSGSDGRKFCKRRVNESFQAAGVIYGANIGTTVTSQLVSFNLSEYAPVLFWCYYVPFLKKPAVKKVGEVVVGLVSCLLA